MLSGRNVIFKQRYTMFRWNTLPVRRASVAIHIRQNLIASLPIQNSLRLQPLRAVWYSMHGDGGHMINPEIACMYQWTFTEDDNSVHINIPLPSLDFDTTRVHVSLTEGGDTVVVEIPDQIPIVEGTLYATAESHSTENVGGTLVVNLKKACPARWDLVIVGPNPTTNKVDPKSAFDLFNAIESSVGPGQYSSTSFIEFAITVGYPPALLYAFRASLHGTREARAQGVALLMVAANQYEDPVAMLTLGNEFAMKEETRDDAFDLYARAAKKGAVIGLSLMGQLISPLSDIPFHHKNAEQAVHLFEAVLEKTEDVIAMSELSKLLYNGVGVTKDVERAKALHEKAHQIEENLPPLVHVDEKESNHSPFLFVYQGIAVTLFVCAGIYVCYRIWKGRHQTQKQ